MGGFFSFFRKKKGTVIFEKALQEIDAKIRTIQDKRRSYRVTWKSRITIIILGFFVIELFYCSLYYFFFRKEKVFLDQVLYFSPIFLIPLITWLLRSGINFYYKRRIANEDALLEDLIAQQKSKVAELADATDFFRTKDLIERYGKTPQDSPPKPQPQIRPEIVRRRPPKTTTPTTPTPSTPSSVLNIPSIPQPTPPITKENFQVLLQQQSPRPNLPKVELNRPWYDNVVDYLVGDSPDFESMEKFDQEKKSILSEQSHVPTESPEQKTL